METYIHIYIYIKKIYKKDIDRFGKIWKDIKRQRQIYKGISRDTLI